MKPQWYAVFTHRGDGRYHLADAKGCRVWRREGVAARFAQARIAEGENCVVLSSLYVSTVHATVSPAGRVGLLIPCPCPLPGTRNLPECPYHGKGEDRP